MTLSSKERAELRSHANRLQVMVHVGHQGITDAVKQSLEEAFANMELVKVQFSKNADTKARTAGNELAEAVGAEVVQAIGRTATLYRKKRDEGNGKGEKGGGKG